MPFADSITALRFPKNISVSKQPHKAFWNRVLVLFVVFKKVLKYELYTPKSNGSYKQTYFSPHCIPLDLLENWHKVWQQKKIPVQKIDLSSSGKIHSSKEGKVQWNCEKFME